MTTTFYAISSCRFLVVTFRSETGDFEDFFVNIQQAVAGRPRMSYKAGIGLFQWLRPRQDEGLWSDGSCVGYQESMLQQVSEINFEMARFFSVISMIFSFITVIGILKMLCIEFNRLQTIGFRIIAMMGTFCSGMTFMLSRSALCNSIFLQSKCELDEGGLVMIAGVLLWFATFVGSVVFLRSSFSDAIPQLAKSEMVKIASDIELQDTQTEAARVLSTMESRNTSSASDEEGNHRVLPEEESRPSSPSNSLEDIDVSREQKSRFTHLKILKDKQVPSNSKRISREDITIDDISHPDSMEVYLSSHLSHTHRKY